MNETFEFSIFDNILASGNRQDCEISGDATEEDWYSWEATEVELSAMVDGGAIINVYGEGIESERYILTWTKVS